MSVAEIVEKIRQLTPEEQDEVFAFVGELNRNEQEAHPPPTANPVGEQPPTE